MKASQLILGVFVTFGTVYGLPTTEASVGTRLAKREWPMEDYRKCLMDDFDNALKEDNKWDDFVCPGNNNIRFKVRQEAAMFPWRSALDCHRWGKDGLLEQIKNGDKQASKKLCSSEGIAGSRACCHISVLTTLHPTKDYTDCLEGEFKASAYEKGSWDKVVCANRNIEFYVTRNDDPQWQSAKDCYRDGAKYIQAMIDAGRPDGRQDICVPGEDKDHPYCCALSFKTLFTGSS